MSLNSEGGGGGGAADVSLDGVAVEGEGAPDTAEDPGGSGAGALALGGGRVLRGKGRPGRGG